jgi:hypothetical protein
VKIDNASLGFRVFLRWLWLFALGLRGCEEGKLYLLSFTVNGLISPRDFDVLKGRAVTVAGCFALHNHLGRAYVVRGLPSFYIV